MYQLACKDMGDFVRLDPAYEHVIKGSSPDEVMDKTMEHVKLAHIDLLQGASSPEQLAQMEQLMRSKITQVA